MRKKHQEVVADFQEQLDQIAKSKARYTDIYIYNQYGNTYYINVYVFRSEKEKAKFQQEVYELLAQIENINKEKVKIQNLILNIIIIIL